MLKYRENATAYCRPGEMWGGFACCNTPHCQTRATLAGYDLKREYKTGLTKLVCWVCEGRV